jgi:hypothetical protein
MSEPGSWETAPAPLAGGKLLSEITNRIVALMREHYGRGPIKAGRKVLAFLSQAHVEPDLTVEMFLMDGPGPGFDTLEVVDRGDAA